MATKHAITTTGQLMAMFGFLKLHSMPMTITVRDGVDRSLSQNALAHKWYSEAATWLGDRSASDVKAHCKLWHGVKMMVVEDEDFREKWQRLVMGRFNTEEKLEFMLEPWDFPVTRLMSKPQMNRYMNEVYKEFNALGVPLSVPELQGYEQR